MVHLPIFYSAAVVASLCTLTAATTESYQCSPATVRTTYPDKCHISKIFGYLNTANSSEFFEQVAPDVHWTLMGTHPLAGDYHNRTVFLTDTIERLAAAGDASKPHSLTLTHVIGGGEEEWSVQEMHALGTMRNGDYYDNRFSWNSRWSKDWKIVEMRAYFDSFLVNKVLTENESGLYNYTMVRTALVPGPVGLGCKNT